MIKPRSEEAGPEQHVLCVKVGRTASQPALQRRRVHPLNSKLFLTDPRIDDRGMKDPHPTVSHIRDVISLFDFRFSRRVSSELRHPLLSMLWPAIALRQIYFEERRPRDREFGFLTGHGHSPSLPTIADSSGADFSESMEAESGPEFKTRFLFVR